MSRPRNRRKPQLNSTPCPDCGARAGEACFERAILRHGLTTLGATHRQTAILVAQAKANASHWRQEP